ncbi:MAG: DUF427 domain-containing protein [Acidimicrobiia bacterium]
MNGTATSIRISVSAVGYSLGFAMFERQSLDAAWSYEDPVADYEQLQGMIAFYASGLTCAWLVRKWFNPRKVTSTAGGSPGRSLARSKVDGELPVGRYQNPRAALNRPEGRHRRRWQIPSR